MAQQINVTSSMNADVTVESSNTTQLVVTGSQNTVAVTIEPASNIAVTMSRSVIGTVANVASANLANYVIQPNQSNITSVGTLTSLTSDGNITAPFFIGNVVGNISGNFTVPGNNTAVLFNQTGNAGASDALKFNYASNVLTANGNIIANYFSGDGSQLTGIVTAQSNNANYANIANIANSVAGANVSGIVANATYATNAGTAYSVAGANVSGTVANATYATNAGTAYSVAGANVSGTVANANYSTYSGTAGVANSVAVANVSGIGNIAVINLNGNGSQILAGNGAWVNTPSTANANYANYAGNAFSVTGSNVSGAVAYATTANSVAVANVSGIGNIATVNLDGNVSNLLTGAGTYVAIPIVTSNANYANFAGEAFSVSGANVTSEVANANYATYSGTVTTNAQPNITSVGTLTGLVVGGDITPNSNITYSLGNNTNRFNNLYLSGNTIILGDQTISANANGIIFPGNINTDNNITALKFYAATGGDEFSGYGFVGATNNNTAMCLTATDEITIYNNAVQTLQLFANNNSKFYANVEANLFIGDGGSLSNITGSNVVGDVGGANHANVADSANSVAVGNVSGIGNIATINLDGNVSNLLAGDGSFVAIPTETANANYANFAGDVVNSSQPNITDVGILTGIYTSGILEFVGNSNAEIQQDHSNGSTTLTIYGGNHSSLLKLDGLADARVEANANVIIKSNSQLATVEWNFDTTGNLTLPGNVFAINYANGTQVQVDNANYANFAGQVVDATQSNITSLGTLTTLTVSGDTIITGNLVVNGNTTSVDSNTIYIQDPVIQIGGGANGDPLTINDGRDRGAVLDYYDTAPISAFMGWKNANGQFEFASNVTLSNNVVTVNQLANISADYYIGNGSQLTGITATTGNANYANFAGEAFSVTGSNVSGEVAFAATANSVALSNVSGAGNIASINLDGNVSNLLTGSGTFVAIPTVSSNANYANFAGTVITNAQPNITSVGTLTNLTVSGIITTTTIEGPTGGGANIDIAPDGIGHVNINADTLRVGDNNVDAQIWTRGTGNLTLKTHDVQANESNIKIINGATGNIQLNPQGIVVTTSNVQANYFIGNGSSLTSIVGGNVNGAVAFATTANAVAGANVSGAVAFATTANSVAGANVSGAVTYATTANAVAGANVSGAVAFATTANSVAVANVSGIGNIATVNLTGSTSNVLYGNGVFAPVSGGSGGSSISNGNSNVNIATSGGDITFSAAGSSNVIYVSNTYLSTSLGFSLTNGTSNALNFSVVQGGSGANGLTANLVNQIYQYWNNSSATFQAFRIGITDTLSNANSKLFSAEKNGVSQFNITKSGNVNFTGVITGNGSGLSSITAANVTGEVANATYATTAGTVTTAAQPNITSLGQLTNIGLTGGFFLSDPSVTPGRFIVSQASGASTGMTSNQYNVITQKWNNASVQFTTLELGATDVTSAANSLLLNATTNAVSKFSINKSGNVTFAGVMTGDGGGLSNITVAATSISNGTSNVSIPVSSGNVNISVGAVANVLVTTTTGINVAGTLNATGNANVSNLGTARVIATGNISGTQLISNIAIGTAPLVVTSTTQVANLNVATAGLATFATTANAVAGANVSGAVSFATTANSVAVANVSGIGNISTVNLSGNSSQVLYGNGVFAAVSGGSGTPGGANTQLQYNNNGAFGGISTVTYDGSNLSLGSISNVKVTGGVSNDFIKTDGTGNLSFVSVAETLLVGTRAGPYTVPITNYTFQVTARTGNVTVYVN